MCLQAADIFALREVIHFADAYANKLSVRRQFKLKAKGKYYFLSV